MNEQRGVTSSEGSCLLEWPHFPFLSRQYSFHKQYIFLECSQTAILGRGLPLPSPNLQESRKGWFYLIDVPGFGGREHVGNTFGVCKAPCPRPPTLGGNSSRTLIRSLSPCSLTQAAWICIREITGADLSSPTRVVVMQHG